ncbi:MULTISPECIES: hypothetical protein [Bacillaceae]|uniref:hypothetical protein n=1 Tax=Bacillaceae TaxID=186817 RepID=UPI00203F61AD|nr:hypothetical protein [Caldibacillus thermoamylovorans]MCM3798926.1 hypothetical protein [Caldibacillus thermoamylovorans]
MLLQKLWKNYSYVILLLLISFICGLIYIHTLSSSSDETEKIEDHKDLEQYTVEMTSMNE